MEGIIIVIFIIIAFNLLNVLLKATKGAQGDQRKDLSADKKQPSVGEEDEARNFWEEETTRFRAKKPSEVTSDQESADENHNEYTDVVDDHSMAPIGESNKTSKVASNLKNMLSQKESLAAAVIVHEILNHPPAIRRKR